MLGEARDFGRNELMLRYNRPDIVVGFALSFKESAVVSVMMRRAEEKGLRLRP
ncbi:MAG: hypothetical protein ACHQ6U_13665 [Thermodesulfobacteriota bacterium]